MSDLFNRIASEQYLDQPGYHPAGTGDTPMTAPMSMVTYANSTVLYGTLHPLVTADGSVVPAAADVSYPSVVPAGQP